jgi:hypothetical protein
MKTHEITSKSNLTPKRVAIIVAMLFIAALSSVMYLQNKNAQLGEALGGSRLVQEKLLSEKLGLERRIARSNAELTKLNMHSAHLKAQLAQRQLLLDKTEKENVRLRNTTAHLDALTRQKEDLESLVEDMKGDMLHFGRTVERLTAENRQFRSDNLALADHISKLNDNLASLQEVVINNALVQAVQGRKKEKSTVVARRTSGLKMEVDLPENMAQGLKLTVRAPDGRILGGEDGIASISEVLSDNGHLASLTLVDGRLSRAKRMRMEFIPRTKLSKGVYTLEVFRGNTSLGCTQIKLR